MRAPQHPVQIIKKARRPDVARTPSRFDYVRFDEVGMGKQARLRASCQALEAVIEQEFAGSPAAGRAKALALTALEQVYMWTGKAIRDDQVNARRDEA